MKGEALCLGKKNSGTLGFNTVLLTNLGADVEKDYNLIYVGYGPSANTMQNGQAAGMSTPAGSPVSAVTKAMAIEKAISGLPLPLHPGAARYYKEKGIKIPARLMVQ